MSTATVCVVKTATVNTFHGGTKFFHGSFTLTVFPPCFFPVEHNTPSHMPVRERVCVFRSERVLLKREQVSVYVSAHIQEW